MTYYAANTSGHFKPLAWLLPIQINAEIDTIYPYFAKFDRASNASHCSNDLPVFLDRPSVMDCANASGEDVAIAFLLVLIGFFRRCT